MSQSRLYAAIAKRDYKGVEKLLRENPALREGCAVFGVTPRLAALTGYYLVR